MTTKSKALAIIEADQYAVCKMGVNIGELIKENLGGEQVSANDLTKIPIPAGGGKTWTVETIDGELDLKELDGIIVYTTLTRAYWSVSYEESGGGSPPDCVSYDGLVGHGDPGGSCGECPLAEWGSGKSERGQACQQRRPIFLVRPDEAMPYVISAPPTSVKTAKQYLLKLASNGLAPHQRITRMTLLPDRNQDGIKFSKIHFSVAGKVSNPEFWAEYAAQMRPLFEQQAREMATEQDENPI
jgi:hypothetical protein